MSQKKGNLILFVSKFGHQAAIYKKTPESSFCSGFCCETTLSKFETIVTALQELQQQVTDLMKYPQNAQTASQTKNKMKEENKTLRKMLENQTGQPKSQA